MDGELPVGFAMALAMNEAAMRNFQSLSREEKDALIRRTHGIVSREEMRLLVDSLAARQGGWYYG